MENHDDPSAINLHKVFKDISPEKRATLRVRSRIKKTKQKSEIIQKIKKTRSSKRSEIPTAINTHTLVDSSDPSAANQRNAFIEVTMTTANGKTRTLVDSDAANKDGPKTNLISNVETGEENRDNTKSQNSNNNNKFSRKDTKKKHTVSMLALFEDSANVDADAEATTSEEDTTTAHAPNSPQATQNANSISEPDDNKSSANNALEKPTSSAHYNKKTNGKMKKHHHLTPAEVGNEKGSKKDSLVETITIQPESPKLEGIDNNGSYSSLNGVASSKAVPTDVAGKISVDKIDSPSEARLGSVNNSGDLGNLTKVDSPTNVDGSSSSETKEQIFNNSDGSTTKMVVSDQEETISTTEDLSLIHI